MDANIQNQIDDMESLLFPEDLDYWLDGICDDDYLWDYVEFCIICDGELFEDDSDDYCRYCEGALGIEVYWA